MLAIKYKAKLHDNIAAFMLDFKEWVGVSYYLRKLYIIVLHYFQLFFIFIFSIKSIS
jgi:hypothetical protein